MKPLAVIARAKQGWPSQVTRFEDRKTALFVTRAMVSGQETACILESFRTGYDASKFTLSFSSCRNRLLVLFYPA